MSRQFSERFKDPREKAKKELNARTVNSVRGYTLSHTSEQICRLVNLPKSKSPGCGGMHACKPSRAPGFLQPVSNKQTNETRLESWLSGYQRARVQFLGPTSGGSQWLVKRSDSF